MNLQLSLGLKKLFKGMGTPREPIPYTDEFVTVWKTTGPNESVTFPFTGTNNFEMDHGDNTNQTVTTPNPTHIYADAGEHIVVCKGSATAYGSAVVADQIKCIDIIHWGSMGITYWNNGFRATGLGLITATDPLLNATDMSNMFIFASTFNGDLSNIDVSNVTSIGAALRGATSFDGDISSWDVSNVTAMKDSFRDATLLNSDVSSWDVSNVTNMTRLFSGTSFSDANYDKLLLAWSLLTLKPNISFSAGTAKYTEVAARAVLTNAPNNWIIADGGAVVNKKLSFTAANQDYLTFGGGKVWIADAQNFEVEVKFSGVGATGLHGLVGQSRFLGTDDRWAIAIDNGVVSVTLGLKNMSGGSSVTSGIIKMASVSGALTLYLDGAPIDTETTALVDVAPTSIHMLVGAYGNATGTGGIQDYATGDIDWIKINNNTLELNEGAGNLSTFSGGDIGTINTSHIDGVTYINNVMWQNV